jgi:hypothetical protein
MEPDRGRPIARTRKARRAAAISADYFWTRVGSSNVPSVPEFPRLSFRLSEFFSAEFVIPEFRCILWPMSTDYCVFALWFQAAVVPDGNTYLGLRASEWIMIAAILVGPILAVVTQFIWQKVRARRDQKVWVFSNLMINRHAPLTPDFVKAANYIDVIFFKNQKVRDRWKTLLAHLSSEAYKPENYTPAAFERFRDLLAELLAEMAKDLGYQFDYTHIKENAWNPSSHGQEFEESIQLRRALLALVEGKGSLNVVVAPHPSLMAQAAPAQTPATAAQPAQPAQQL